jgi:putative ABC transport system permease protein
MFEQSRTVTLLNLLNVPKRWGSSLVIIVSIGGVVAVLVSVLAMSTGLLKMAGSTGQPDRAIVLRNGSSAELTSTMNRDATLTILDSAGVRRTEADEPIGSAEVLVLVELTTLAGSHANMPLRGVGPGAFKLRPEIRLVEGRNFEPGRHELIVGKHAQHQFRGLEVGHSIPIRGADWTIVGAFESNGDSREGELLAGADTVLSVYRRGNTFQSVTVQLENAESFATFKDALTSNPSLSVEVTREPDYSKAQTGPLTSLISIIAYLVGGIMAVGALMGALNAMYSVISARRREIATLRAIGFGAGAVVISVLIEALALALVGALVGAAIAWLLFNGNTVSTSGGNIFQLSYELAVTPGLLVTGMVWASVIGLVGGLAPAIRAARMPVATALRAT